jgi:hypothetical protein
MSSLLHHLPSHSPEILVIYFRGGPNRKHNNLLLCLPIRCLETSSIVVCVFISTGMCLPSRCLAMNYSGFQASCHSTLQHIEHLSLWTTIFGVTNVWHTLFIRYPFSDDSISWIIPQKGTGLSVCALIERIANWIDAKRLDLIKYFNSVRYVTTGIVRDRNISWNLG